MLIRLVQAVVVAVFITLVLSLVGSILVTLKVDIAVTIGNWLKTYGGVLGVLAGIWFFCANMSFTGLLHRNKSE